MSVRIHCLTLPVDDVQASILFYRDGLGLIYEDKGDHAIFLLDDEVMLVALPRAQFAGFAQMSGQEVAPRTASGAIMSFFAESAEEVDTILERAVDFASFGEAAEERAWGYSGYLADPDGHIWEILYNPEVLGPYYDDEDE